MALRVGENTGELRMGHEGWVWSKYIVLIYEILRLIIKTPAFFLDSCTGFLIHKIRNILLVLVGFISTQHWKQKDTFMCSKSVYWETP